jgi:hypothetical protein
MIRKLMQFAVAVACGLAVAGDSTVARRGDAACPGIVACPLTGQPVCSDACPVPRPDRCP